MTINICIYFQPAPSSSPAYYTPFYPSSSSPFHSSSSSFSSSTSPHTPSFSSPPSPSYSLSHPPSSRSRPSPCPPSPCSVPCLHYPPSTGSRIHITEG